MEPKRQRDTGKGSVRFSNTSFEELVAMDSADKRNAGLNGSLTNKNNRNSTKTEHKHLRSKTVLENFPPVRVNISQNFPMHPKEAYTQRKSVDSFLTNS